MSAFEVEQDAGFGANVNNHGVLQLGYFTLNIINPIPVGGTVVSLGAVTPGVDSAQNGGSDLDNSTANNVLASTTNTTIAAAPEPSGALVLLIGGTGLGLAIKRRHRGGKN